MNEERNNQPQTAEPSLSEILQVRRDKLKALQDAGRNPFEQTRFARSAYSADIKEDFEAYDGKTLQAAGRIMSKRGMGKAIFCDIQDDRGQIQLYVRKDAVSEQEFADFRKYDIGDIIGVSGYAFKTKTGEISIHVQQVTLLSKSLRPLPEKFHGMTNMELRYRQRYVDLIMNPESKRNFQIRSQFVAYLRRYLDGLGFMEVETPVLSPIAGGATARPFITHHNTLDIDMYMRIATELHLKRLIVGGIERVYEVGRIFRNEGMDTKHNPEFTTCELYQAYTNLDGMMDILEGILSGAAKEILGTYQLQWLGHDVDLTPSWRRVTMANAVKEVTGADFMAIVVTRTRRSPSPRAWAWTWKTSPTRGATRSMRRSTRRSRPHSSSRRSSPCTRSRSARWPSAAPSSPRSPSAMRCSSAAARWATPSPSSTTPSTSTSASRRRPKSAPTATKRPI